MRWRCRRTPIDLAGSSPLLFRLVEFSPSEIGSARVILSVRGKKIEAEHIGRSGGATLVFLHEGLGSLGLWRDFPQRVAEATGLPAFVYSRAGHGQSDPAPMPRPVRYMHDEAQLLPAILAAAEIDDPVLVGHSDGASI